jgi:NAD(P)H-dependent FMN reductase
LSAALKNALDWASISFDESVSEGPLQNKKVGVVSCSYLSTNQISDSMEILENLHCNCFPEAFYLNIKPGLFLE